MDINYRINKLKQIKIELSKNREKILSALEKDLGKNHNEAYISEYYTTLSELEHTIKNLSKWEKPKKIRGQMLNFFSKSYIIKKPYGKVSIASPWNYPFYLSMVPLIGALAAGNKVLLKTSHKSFNTSILIKEILGKIFDENEVKVIGLDEDNDKKRFLEDETDFIFFTGSKKVGDKIAEFAAKKSIPYVLELGGKSPVIIFSDFDISVAAKRIMYGKLINAGQTCIAPDYVLIEEDKREIFIDECYKVIDKLYGENILDSKFYSKIIDKEKIEYFKTMLKAEKIFCETDISYEKQKMKPKIFATDMDSLFMKEEIFGPFLPVLSYKNIDDILDTIKKNNFPLAMYIFTNDKFNAEKIIKNISAGGVTINDTLLHITNYNLPFGGIKNSGIGKYHGKYSYDIFTYETGVMKRSKIPDLLFRYPPYKIDLKKLFRK